MFDQLKEIETRYEELQHQLADPAIASDHEAYSRVHREVVGLQEIVDKYRAYESIQASIRENRALLDDPDPDIRELARAEIGELEEQLPGLERSLRLSMLPTDPLDDKNIILEIRAGTGGDEASLFAGDLFEMYSRFAATKGWKIDVLSSSAGTMGGFKEIIASIRGDRVYSQLKWESGVHRVQRVPETESQGRIHTSACTVAILPEAEEVDVTVDPGDLRIDTYRASGAGGQHVNMTDSAVRITHIPTGLVVTCQDERSQHKNRARAMQLLRTRLLDEERERQRSARADERRAQVGSGDRSERIRTYNFPQNRLTDHRIGLTLYKLDRVIAGELDEVIDELSAYLEAEQLKSLDGTAAL